jgi:hypothetical protein
LLRQISELGDFQPASITNATRRCGKPSWHCAKPNNPRHGPHFQLTQKINGKTATQKLPSLAAVRKAEREIAQCRELRSKPVLAAVGQVEVWRPYCLCPHCHGGQFPADVELDVEMDGTGWTIGS